MTISWDMEQHTQYLNQQHMHLHRQHMQKLRDEQRTQMDVDDTENTNNILDMSIIQREVLCFSLGVA